LGQNILLKLDESNALKLENEVYTKIRDYVLKLNEEVENYQIELKSYMEKEFRNEKRKLEEVNAIGLWFWQRVSGKLIF
jgi:hypothetical protein